MPSLANYRQQVDQHSAAYALALASWQKETTGLELASDEVTNAEEALKVLQIVAQGVQETAHKQVAQIVSRCLEAVFAEPYEFRIVFEQKRGHTEARLVFLRDGMELDPLSATGGGVVDMAAFGLRLSCLLLSRPPLRRLLVLDEPFRFVSAEYRPRVRLLLETLSAELHVQILMVTHITELQIGTVLEL